MGGDLDDWSGLDENSLDEETTKDQVKAEAVENYEQKLMSGLIKNNPAAMKYLFDRFVDAAIAVPGDDLLQIGLVFWLFYLEIPFLDILFYL